MVLTSVSTTKIILPSMKKNQKFGEQITNEYVSANLGNTTHPVENCSIISEWPSTFLYLGDLAFKADLAFAFSINGLRVFNLSTSNVWLDIVGSYKTHGSYGQHHNFAIDGNLLYAAFGPKGMLVLNISDPTNPRYHHLYNDTGNYKEIYLDANRAYITTNDGLKVLDIANPLNPVFLGNYSLESFSKIYAKNDIVYLTSIDHSNELVLLNVSDPTNITKITSYDTGNTIHNFAFKNDISILANGNSGMTVLNISNPSSIYEMGNFTAISGNVIDLALDGNSVFIFDATTTVRKISILDPTNPIEQQSFATNMAFGNELYFYNGFIFIIGQTYGLGVFDVSTTPIKLYESLQFFFAYESEIKDDFLFYTADNLGVMVFDISDKANPEAILNMWEEVGPFAMSIDIHGNFAYIGSGFNGFYIININNPRNPTLQGESPESTSQVIYRSNKVYALSNTKDLMIFDVSDKTNPRLISYKAISPPVSTYDFWLDGNYVFIAHNDGITIMDVSNPTAITEISTIQHGLQETFACCVKDNYLFMADYFAGFEVYDISDITQPQRLYYSNESRFYGDIYVVENLLFLTSLEKGVEIFDVTNATRPVKIGHYHEHVMVADISYNDQYAILTTEMNGFVLLGSDIFPKIVITQPSSVSLFQVILPSVIIVAVPIILRRKRK